MLSSPDCERRLRNTRLGAAYRLHPGMLCAGGQGGKDACKVGGGMLHFNPLMPVGNYSYQFFICLSERLRLSA